jgi:hypothetical protein
MYSLSPPGLGIFHWTRPLHVLPVAVLMSYTQGPRSVHCPRLTPTCTHSHPLASESSTGLTHCMCYLWQSSCPTPRVHGQSIAQDSPPHVHTLTPWPRNLPLDSPTACVTCGISSRLQCRHVHRPVNGENIDRFLI